MHLVLIVEGHGEVVSLPLLVRSWFPEVIVKRPILIHRDRFLGDPQYRSRVLDLGRRRDPDALLILLDAHGGPPSTQLEALHGEMERVLGDVPAALVVAVQEYEAWFLAAGTSIGLPEDTLDAEGVQGAKERLKRMLGRYRPTADQPRLTRALADAWSRLDEDRRAPSLARLHDELSRILGDARTRARERPTTDPTAP